MKYFFLILIATPNYLFAQESTNSLNISGGGEYLNENTHAWNIEINYQDRIGKTRRFWSEFGVNYSVLEYNRDSQFRLDTCDMCGPFAYGLVYYPGYMKRELTHYSRSSILRFQAGFNYSIIDGEKFKLSSGVNLAGQLVLNHREHGQRVYYPFFPEDSLETIDEHYHLEQTLKTGTNMISIYVQPHLDASIALVNNLWLASRFAYYHELIPDSFANRVQFNLGLRFYW